MVFAPYPRTHREKDIKYTELFACNRMELSIFYIAGVGFLYLILCQFLQFFNLMNDIINISVCLETHTLPHRSVLQGTQSPSQCTWLGNASRHMAELKRLMHIRWAVRYRRQAERDSIRRLAVRERWQAVRVEGQAVRDR